MPQIKFIGEAIIPNFIFPKELTEQMKQLGKIKIKMKIKLTLYYYRKKSQNYQKLLFRFIDQPKLNPIKILFAKILVNLVKN